MGLFGCLAVGSGIQIAKRKKKGKGRMMGANSVRQDSLVALCSPWKMTSLRALKLPCL